VRPITVVSLVFAFGVALVTFGACDLSKIMDDDGSDGGGGSGGSGSDDDGDGKGGGAGTCNDDSPDCKSCRTCAAASSCKVAVDSCLDDPLCAALDECLALCGVSPDCEETCRAQYAASVDTYDAARSCMDCAVCPDLCAGLTVCE
jgi:hypothetical protein